MLPPKDPAKEIQSATLGYTQARNMHVPTIRAVTKMFVLLVGWALKLLMMFSFIGKTLTIKLTDKLRHRTPKINYNIAFFPYQL